ncbi:MAG: hypothetical protein EOO14_07540 [Chitinophagaceae bacterium]|nr:MAG: hypothetical protein EOO14_07540 [Chitinophagaceae bacterium]
MTTTGLQVGFFQYLKTKLPEGSSLAEEVAATLGISTDSAYRRIRGEKPVLFEELHTLCTRYRLSLDTLLNLQADIIPFQGKYVDPVSFRFDEYLTAVGQQVKYMASFKEREMYYLCKDIPLFHHYHYSELAAFKYFFWHKTLLQSPGFSTSKIRLSDYPEAIFALGRKALDTYNQLNSYEIWNIESLTSTLRQVEYYHDSRFFQSKEDLLLVYEALDKLFIHLEAQAEQGYKFDNRDPERKPLSSFQLYFNEVVSGDNSILAVLDTSKICFLTHSAINFMVTRDVAFCDNMYSYYQNLMRKSTLISSVSERERSRFFKLLRKRIAGRKQALGAGAST